MTQKRSAYLFMVAEPRKGRTRSTSPTLRFGCLLLLLLLGGLAAGGAWQAEAEFYGGRRGVEKGTLKRRTWYVFEIHADTSLIKTRKRLDQDHKLKILESHYPPKVEVQYPTHWKLWSIQPRRLI